MTIKAELKNEEGDAFKVHLNQLAGKNAQYFDHLSGIKIKFSLSNFVYEKDIVFVVSVYAVVASVLGQIWRLIIKREFLLNTQEATLLIPVHVVLPKDQIISLPFLIINPLI